MSMKNPGFWNLVPVHSEDITITDVNVSAAWSAGVKEDPFQTPNTDGFEPMWSNNVTVSDESQWCVRHKYGAVVMRLVPQMSHCVLLHAQSTMCSKQYHHAARDAARIRIPAPSCNPC